MLQFTNAYDKANLVGTGWDVQLAPRLVRSSTAKECVTRGSKESRTRPRKKQEERCLSARASEHAVLSLRSCQLQTAKPSDIAIIMYTSGTTGAPKGPGVQFPRPSHGFC